MLSLSTCLLNSVYEIVGSVPSLKKDSARRAITNTTRTATTRPIQPPGIFLRPEGGPVESGGVPSVRHGWSGSLRGGTGLLILGRYDTKCSPACAENAAGGAPPAR